MRNKQRDYRFAIEVAAFMLLLYGTSIFVYLNGDDFMYGTFAHTGILENVLDYYFTGNGRFWINILDSCLLWFDRYAFIVLLPWIVLVFIILFAKNVQRIMAGYSDWSKEKELIRVGIVLFACLDVICLRETVFWITGMMNYLFPAVMFLLAYLLFRKSRDGEIYGIKLLGYYLVCFLTSSSVEQYALMFVGMMTLHYGYDLLNKDRIPIKEWMAYGVSLLGLGLLILAPGNFARVDEQQMPGFAENLWTLLYQDTVHEAAMPYLLMLSAIGAWVGRQAKRRILKVCMYATPCVILLTLCTFLANKAVVLIGLILIWLIQMAAMFGMLEQKSRRVFLFLCFVGIGSQVMLLISAVWGFRCMLSLYLVYMLLIGCLLYHAQTRVKMFILSCGITASIHPVVAVFCGLSLVLLHCVNKQNMLRALSNSITYVCSAAALVSLIVGYAGNTQMHEQNLVSTTYAPNQIITLKELPNDTYSWYSIPMNEFHEEYYRQLHQIAESVEIVYETMPEEES